MILEALIDLFAAIVGGFLDFMAWMLPSPPAWFIDAIELVAPAYAWVSQLNTWLPIDEGLIASAAVLTAWGISMVVQITRTVISYFTLGGGGS